MTPLVIDNPRNFCEACAIRNRAICADLDRDEIGLLNSIGRRRELAVGCRYDEHEVAALGRYAEAPEMQPAGRGAREPLQVGPGFRVGRRGFEPRGFGGRGADRRG